jgi:hypothetical protein
VCGAYLIAPIFLPLRAEAEVKELIEDLGGTVINRMAHLRQQDRLAGSRGFVWRSAWGDLPSVILISDKHHRTLKYLMALAAVSPSLSPPLARAQRSARTSRL